MIASDYTRVQSSFRDPSGHIFKNKGEIYRAIFPSYSSQYDALIKSNLFQSLFEKKYLIHHEEVNSPLVDGAYKIIRPQQIKNISYPYEWCFGQLKDAALLTLEIALEALNHNFILKDATTYNIQFVNGRPIFIDTLSFDFYKEGTPWIAYKQFIEHFLCPLLLIKYVDYRFGKMSALFIDGIPLSLCKKTLPLSSWFSLSVIMHIHLHAIFQNKYSAANISNIKNTQQHNMGKDAVKKLLWHLKDFITGLSSPWRQTEWGDYYQHTNYSDEAFEDKKRVLQEWSLIVMPNKVWDLGGNIGHFSRVFSDQNIETVCWDIDPEAVEKNYQLVKKNNEQNILPLVLDLTNPSPAIGWNLSERESIKERAPVDLAMALALIHHLCISNNLPLEYVAKYFSEICKYLIIEFVPKEDSQVKILLTNREDIFPFYQKDCFENSFQKYFRIEQTLPVKNSLRTLYLMKNISL